jgi:hypothetical protein
LRRLLQSLALIRIPMAALVAVVTLVFGLRSLSLLDRSAFAGALDDDSLAVDLLVVHFVDRIAGILIVVEFLGRG